MNTNGQLDVGEERSLSLVDGQIQLPCHRTIVPGSRKYNGIIKQVLRNEAPELLEAIKAGQDKPSRLARIALGAGLVMYLIGVFLAWPPGQHLKDTSMVYEISTRTSDQVDEKYQSLLEDCEGLMEKEEYVSCVEKLTPCIDEILDNKPIFSKNARLLYIYLRCNQLELTEEASSLVQLCDRALLYEKRPEWKLYRLYFLWAPYIHTYNNFKDMLETHQKSSALTDGNPSSGKIKIKEKDIRKSLVGLLKSLSREADSIRASLNNRHEGYQAEQITLDKLACQILIAQWSCQIKSFSFQPLRGRMR